MLLFLALSPILALLILILVFRWTTLKAAFIASLLSLVVLLTFWKSPVAIALASWSKALFVSLDLFLIIFGAMYFLEILRGLNAVSRIESWLLSLSSDRRVQGILIAWFFGGFIEASAGFGTPAVIVAPLLRALGFSLMSSITLPLLANSTAVAFGAVGTPVRIGLASLATPAVAPLAAFVNVFSGSLIPLFMLIIMAYNQTDRKPRDAIKQGLGFALFCGLAFTLPSLLVSYAGYEFPSLVGSLSGLLLTSYAVKNSWIGPTSKAEKQASDIGFFTAFWPYLVLCVFLIIGKWVFSEISISVPLGEGQFHRLSLFNPGYAFLTTILVLLLIQPKTRHLPLLRSAKETLGRLPKPMATIFLVTTVVQVMILSKVNTADLPSMIQYTAIQLNTPYLPLLSPLIGAFGSFVAGSATVSNLLLAPLQAQMAEPYDFALPLILALQLVGAGVGNMVSVTNCLAVEASLKVEGYLRAILTQLWWPCLIYATVAGALGMLLAKNTHWISWLAP